VDRFEGAPHVYARRDQWVFDTARRPRCAYVYELRVVTEPIVAPSLHYVLTLLRAYRQHGFSLHALSSALAFNWEASQ
jgi:hypothetical protein